MEYKILVNNLSIRQHNQDEIRSAVNFIMRMDIPELKFLMEDISRDVPPEDKECVEELLPVLRNRLMHLKKRKDPLGQD